VTIERRGSTRRTTAKTGHVSRRLRATDWSSVSTSTSRAGAGSASMKRSASIPVRKSTVITPTVRYGAYQRLDGPVSP